VSGGPAVYSIPAGVPFVDALAAGLLARAGGDPLALARTTVLLPTRRACRALTDAFLRRTGGKATLLPILRPLGEVDEEELLLAADAPLDGAAGADLAPAIPDMRRRLLLARLILEGEWALGGRATGRGALTADQAAALAQELARFLDQAQTQRLDLDRLADLVPEDYADHWRITLDFLRLIGTHWPRLLAAEGCLDPAQRRNRLLAAQTAAWDRAPPADPVIAAGSTGSIPATADLLKCVAGLPAGGVVLPGLDRDSDADSWRALGPTHPQAGLARLLAHLEIDRDAVRDWPAPGLEKAAARAASRRRLIAEALLPAAATATWRDRPPPEAATEGIARIDCASAQEEAVTIALLLRQTLETPGRTAALVTPDRGLARRVAAELRRWEIEIDDSAGTPLARTPPGAFLRLAAACLAEEAAPVPLLALLKHPLAAGGLAPGAFRDHARRLERAVLRGPRPGPGFAGLRRALTAARRAGAAAEVAALKDWLAPIARAAAPFARLLGRDSVPLADLVRAHLAFAEALAASESEPGPARLWAGEAGEAAAEFVADLLDAAGGFGRLGGAAYPALLDELLAGRAVRPRHGAHPRLFVWGLLEARMQQADLVVLGGLNEGSWPPEPAADPWMSRPMRAAFGLPPLEARIGLAAHDFAQAVAAENVVLTRARRVEGAPTVPSRWLLRLDARLAAAGRSLDRGAAAEAAAWRDALDRAAATRPAPAPAPAPPVAARPRRLSVTQIETWMANPYAIYARKILGLERLDPLDAAPGAAERGSLIHAALEAFLRAHPDGLPADAADKLRAIGAALFDREALAHPNVRAFWWPRFLRIADWFLDWERGRRAGADPVGAEMRGKAVLDGPAGPFTLTATADRIDRLAAGGLSIVDYKTGAVPARGAIEAGRAPQLSLEAVIAAAGGFGQAAAGPTAELVHVHLSGGDPPGKAEPYKGDVGALVAAARDGLAGLIAAFDDPATPYLAHPDPGAGPRFDDYAHLARLGEWGVGGGDES